MLKIYYMDCGWAGSIVVVAKNEQQARSIMCLTCDNYNEDSPIEEHEIEDSLCLHNYGDL